MKSILCKFKDIPFIILFILLALRIVASITVRHNLLLRIVWIICAIHLIKIYINVGQELVQGTYFKNSTPERDLTILAKVIIVIFPFITGLLI